MRTSHKRIQKRIQELKTKITDKKFFSSEAFAHYLTDIAETITKRYKRNMTVITFWNYNANAEVACTDNKYISLNVGNSITQSFPTRMLKADSLLGLVGHEIGHVLYTDFVMHGIYSASLSKGHFYPDEPSGLTSIQEANLTEIHKHFDSGDKTGISVICSIAHTFYNILEDVYIENRMCTDFPGNFRFGIQLNNERMLEMTDSIASRIKKGDYPLSIVISLILQYARSGDINNLGGYEGEYLDTLYECTEIIDSAIYDDDPRIRFDTANRLLIHCWSYIKDWMKTVKEKEKEAGSKTGMDDLLKELLDKLQEQVGSSSAMPDRNSTPVIGSGTPPAAKKPAGSPNGTGKHEKDSEASEANGESEHHGSLKNALNKLAEEQAATDYERELSKELQLEAEKINYDDIHKYVKIHIHRMATIPKQLIERYQVTAPTLMLLSKKMQKQVAQALKDKKTGYKRDGLLFGKRINARHFTRDDGKIFYNHQLPSDTPELAVAVLVDESGSMDGNRIENARNAAIVIYHFCHCLDIPIAVYGHTEAPGTLNVQIQSYAEFDSADNKDMYRMMSICARQNNRDGAALRFTAERLVTRPENTKLLILISDGQPNALNYRREPAFKDLLEIKKEYTRKGITMFAAAIGDDKPQIQKIYQDGFLDITDLMKLPMNLTKLIMQHIRT